MAENLVINGTTYPGVTTLAMQTENGETVGFYPDAVRFNEQELTDEQKAQARKNIGANNLLVATVTEDENGELSCDYTLEALLAAYHAGVVIVVDYAPTGVRHNLNKEANGTLFFSGNTMNSTAVSTLWYAWEGEGGILYTLSKNEYVSYSKEETLTDEQKAIAKKNIGVGLVVVQIVDQENSLANYSASEIKALADQGREVVFRIYVEDGGFNEWSLWSTTGDKVEFRAYTEVITSEHRFNNTHVFVKEDKHVFYDEDGLQVPQKTSALTNDSGFISGDVFGGYDRFYDSIARMRVNPTEPLDIQTYDGSNQPTHPKVLYFENGWAGHKYWLTYSPFPNNNDTYENPCIGYSEDGVSFISDGISNPIEDTPVEDGVKVGYNSDPHLVVVDGVMECWWRTHFQSGANANHEVIFRKTSADGVSWSEKEELFRVQDASAGSCLSPAVIFEDGIYKIWTVYKQQVMRYYESTTGKDWVHIRDINVDNPNYPAYKIWHIDVISTGKGYEFVGCYHPTDNYDDNRYIYYAVSADNITYSDRVLILTPGKAGNFDATELYRPAILRLDNKVMIYYGCRNGWGNWRIGMIEAPNPYLFNAILKNGMRLDSLESNISKFESRISALESGSGDSGESTTTYAIEYNLTNCTSSNTAISAIAGSSFTSTLSIDVGYTLGIPTITMGGVDITATVWDEASATISIPSVTGAISITCEATIDLSSSDDMTVVDSFSDSTWTAGYINDFGVVQIDSLLNMHHSQLMPVSYVEVGVTTASYLRVSYYDADKNYLGYDRGFGIGVAAKDASGYGRTDFAVDVTAGVYFNVSYDSAIKDDVSVVPIKEQFETTEEPTASYVGSDHGAVDGEWTEQNGGNSIVMTGGTWNDGILTTDGVDDKLVLPLTNAKTVVLKAKLLSDYSVDGKARYVFDCRSTATAYLLNYMYSDYLGSGANVYVGTRAFKVYADGIADAVENGLAFAERVVSGEWYYFTIVFASKFTGNMVICAHNSGNTDFMEAELEEIKVYGVDITTG